MIEQGDLYILGDRSQLFTIICSMISTYLIQGFFNIDVIMVLPLFWIVLGLYQGQMEEEKLIEGGMTEKKPALLDIL